MSDIAETVHDTKWDLKLAVNSGKVLTVANREVTVSRVGSDAERKIRERPLININLQLEDVSEAGGTHLALKSHQQVLIWFSWSG